MNVDNAAALGLYERHGFDVEGPKRGDIPRADRLVDTHLRDARDDPFGSESKIGAGVTEDFGSKCSSAVRDDLLREAVHVPGGRLPVLWTAT